MRSLENTNKPRITRITRIPKTAKSSLFPLIRVIGVIGGLFLLFGCASGESKAEKEKRHVLGQEIVGRWIGEPVDAPAEVWFEHAKFDLWFSDRGDFSALVSTYAKHPYELRFEGEYEVKHSNQIVVDERNLGGKWTVSGATRETMTLSRGDITLALKKRLGT